MKTDSVRRAPPHLLKNHSCFFVKIRLKGSKADAETADARLPQSSTGLMMMVQGMVVTEEVLQVILSIFQKQNWQMKYRNEMYMYSAVI